MWLRRIRFSKKSLSSVEFLVLILVPEREIDAKELISNLNKQFHHWKAERGTIYPILHRLDRYGLLEISEENGKMQFRRTNSGTNLILDQIDSFKNQIETNFEFVCAILKSIQDDNPYTFSELKDFYKKQLTKSLEQLEELEESESDQWKEVKLD